MVVAPLTRPPAAAQVLEESLSVLSEVQDLIREEAGLPPGSSLERQPPELMANVSLPLMEALEVRSFCLCAELIMAVR